MKRRLRYRRRIARALTAGRSLPGNLAREWAWLCRDIRDVRAELRSWDNLHGK